MKIRILVYGILILIVCLMATCYLVYTNQGRILEAARYKLTSIAREKWSVDIEFGESELNLYRNAVAFRNVGIITRDKKISVTIGEVEMAYSLRELAGGNVHFKKIYLKEPVLKVMGEGTQGMAAPPVFVNPDRILAVLGIAEKIDVEKGSIILLSPENESLVSVERFGVQISTVNKTAITKIWIDNVKVNHDVYHGYFKQCFFQGELKPDGLVVNRLDGVADSGPVKASGRIDPDGSLMFDFTAKADLAVVGESFELPVSMEGLADGSGRFEFRNNEWALVGKARTRGLAIEGEPIPDSLTRVELTRNRCAFSGIESLMNNGGMIRGDGYLEWSPGKFGYSFNAHAENIVPFSVKYVSKNLPHELIGPFSGMTGEVFFSGISTKLGFDWHVNVDVKGLAGKYFGSREVHVSGEVESGPRGVSNLNNFTLLAGALRGKWAGTIQSEGGLSIAVIADTEDLSEGLEPFGMDWIGGKASFAGNIIGSGGSVEVTGGLTVEPGVVRGVSFERAWGRIGYKEGVYSADELTVQKDGGKAIIYGSFSENEGGYVNASISLDGIQVIDGRSLLDFDLPVEGLVSGNIALSGRQGALEGSVNITAPTLSVGSWGLERAAADFSFGPSKAVIRSIEAYSRDGRVFFTGEVDRGELLTGTLDAFLPSLEKAMPGRHLTGVMRLQGLLDGRLKDPDFNGTFTWREAGFMEVAYPDMKMQVRKKNGRITAEGIFLDQFPAVLEVKTRTPYPLTGRISFSDLDLQSVLPYARPLIPEKLESFAQPFESRIAGSLEFEVPLDNPGGIIGALNFEAMQIMMADEVSRLSRPARIKFSRGSFYADEMNFQGDLHDFILKGGLQEGKLDLRMDGVLDLSFLAKRYPRLRQVAVKPEVSLSVSGSLSSPEVSGRAEVSHGRLGLPWLKSDVTDISGRIDFDRDIVNIRDLTMLVDQDRLKGNGWIDLVQRKINLSIGGAIPLASIELPLTGVKEYNGRGEIDLLITGAAEKPNFDADIIIRDGLIRLSGFQTSLRDIGMVLDVNDEYIRVKEASASMNGGLFTGSGYVVWMPGSEPEDVYLDLGAESIYLSVQETMKMVTSAEIILRGSPDEYFLGGQIVIQRGKYFKDMTPRPVLLFREKSKEFILENRVEHPVLSKLRMDLRIIGEEGFWIENNVAQINTGLDIRAKGTLAEPVISGDIRVREGAIYYLGKKFRLDESSAIFPNKYPPDPYLNISAQTIVSQVEINLLLQGTLSNLTLDLYSNPPYSREDIISLLTLGAPRSYLENKGREVSALGAMMVFSGSFISRIEEEARDFTGLEVFQIEPTLSDTGGAARLVVGKQLSDRIFLSYSRGLNTTGDDQFSMEYQLLDFLSLVGKQDRQGTYNFDLVYSLEVPVWWGR